MATKTVIKELFEFIRLSHPNIDEDVNEEFWEDKFRRQIIDAHINGQADIVEVVAKNFPGYFKKSMIEVRKAIDGDTDVNAEDYYTQTYTP